MNMHGTETPSAWLQRWAHLIAPNSTVLDVACGAGRHLRYLAALGHRVTGVDRNPEAVAMAQASGLVICADIENGPWPFAGQTFGCVVVTNYLWRPLLPTLVASVAPGGVLIYETFMSGNERFGKPSNPEFLLRPGELLEVVRGQLTVVAFEQGEVTTPRPAVVQRLCATRRKEFPLPD